METSRKKQVNDLARCVGLSELLQPIVTSEIRAVRHTGPAVGGRANGSGGLQEHRTVFTEERTIVWRELVREVLDVLDVCRSHSSAVPEFPNLPQGDLKRRGEIKRALQRLISSATARDELPSLIETIVSNMKAVHIVNHLQGANAQAFVDVLYQA